MPSLGAIGPRSFACLLPNGSLIGTFDSCLYCGFTFSELNRCGVIVPTVVPPLFGSQPYPVLLMTNLPSALNALRPEGMW